MAIDSIPRLTRERRCIRRPGRPRTRPADPSGSPGSLLIPTLAPILAVTGNPARFRSVAAFASFAGTAPIAASSGDTIRHRLNRGGNRQLNKVIHAAARPRCGSLDRGVPTTSDAAARARPTPKPSARSSGTSPPRSAAPCRPTPPPGRLGVRRRRRRTGEADQPGRGDRQRLRVIGHSSDPNNLPHT